MTGDRLNAARAPTRCRSPRAREAIGAADPAVLEFGLRDPRRGHALLLRIERSSASSSAGLVTERYAIWVTGGCEHASLPARMATSFKGPGTRRHVGRRSGAPELAGWQPRLWTASPARGSEDRQTIGGGDTARPGDSGLVVTDPN